MEATQKELEDIEVSQFPHAWMMRNQGKSVAILAMDPGNESL